jgi:ATP-dependent protease HslVU (ClpYQ) ATPase subunit
VEDFVGICTRQVQLRNEVMLEISTQNSKLTTSAIRWLVNAPVSVKDAMENIGVARLFMVVCWVLKQ